MARMHFPDHNKIRLIVLFCVLLGGIGVFATYKESPNAVASGGRYDVIVAGAGPSGIAASIQAARMGSRVLLVEETDWIGGQMTAAGVGTMDEGDNNAARKSGIYHEFFEKASAYYASTKHSYSTCYFYQRSFCVDPKDGQKILRDMLHEQAAHLTVITGTHISAVTKNGNTVTGLVAGGKKYSSKVVIDAGEYGDVLAQAGAAYRLGTGTSSKPNPSGCIQAMTHVAIIKYYRQGVPKELRFQKAPPGYTAAVKKHFMALISNASGFDYMATKQYPYTFKSYVAWRGYPNTAEPYNYDVRQQGRGITRTGLNQGNDYPLGKGLSTAFIQNPSVRQQETCRAKLLTLQMVYFIQHDLGQDHWSVANDEGYDTAYNREQNKKCPELTGYQAIMSQMSQEPYVREGRRLIGTQTLTGETLSQRPWADDSQSPHYDNSIAVGYYPIDLHACKAPADLEKGLDSPAYLEKKPGEGPFEVPMGVLIPQKMNGLLAAEKNISASRLAEGAIREQPIAMDIGQAAGALAALSAQKNTQPRDISAKDVQAVLTKAHVIFTVQ